MLAFRAVVVVAVAAVAPLTLAACSEDATGPTTVAVAGSQPPSTDGTVPSTSGTEPGASPVTDTPTTPSTAAGDESSAAAAAAAQAAIDLGDDLDGCPFDPAGVVAAVRGVLTLAPDFDGQIEENGQVFYGGDVDITYCHVRPQEGAYNATTGVVDMRVDVHPGIADVATYLDEEWAEELEDVVPQSAAGGTLTVGCFAEYRCLAMWQGADLFIALMVEAADTVAAEETAAALVAIIPVVTEDLVNGR